MRAVVKFDGNDEFCNLDADEINMADGLVTIYKGNKLVGVFKIESIKAAYLSEKVERG